ncbi:exostosin family protein [Mucilaginibacter litoreus]|uniref:Exostosin family protein n=1 Tax=Mucilaginibacter litoreus TaxID=1048221 RepID=A0ABW3ALW9_9SPHI
MMYNQGSAWIKVYITSAYNDAEPLASIIRYASLDRLKKFELVDSADDADFILFVENSRYHADRFYNKLKSHYLVKKYPDKVFMYNPHDKPWLVLPGLYASMPKQFFNKNYIAATPYIENINPYIKYDAAVKPEYLFSFVGSPNSAPRRSILKLSHPHAFIKASASNMFGGQDLTDEKLSYAKLLSQSKFVLCPRGAGTSSFRIFETMQAGRVPVIISDNWVAPKGPRWSDFALFIPEKDVAQVPAIIEKADKEWPLRCALSREAWENFFSPEVFFTYLLESVVRLNRTNADIRLSTQTLHYIPFLKYVFRAGVIQKLKSALAYNR